MTNIPNQTTSSDDDNASTYDELKEAPKSVDQEYYEFYFALLAMKRRITTLMEERNSKQGIKDFVEDHVFRLIDNIECAQPSNSPVTPLSDDSILDSIPTWKNFKSKAQVVVKSFPSWHSKRQNAVRIGADLTPWLTEEMELNDREAYVVTSVLKDKFKKDFPH